MLCPKFNPGDLVYAVYPQPEFPQAGVLTSRVQYSISLPGGDLKYYLDGFCGAHDEAELYDSFEEAAQQAQRQPTNPHPTL